MVSAEILSRKLKHRAKVELLTTSIFSWKFLWLGAAFQTVLVTVGLLSHFSVFRNSIKNNF